MQILEDANIKFDFVDVEDTTSPRMSQVIALTNDKELPQLFVEGLPMSEKSKFESMLGLNFECHEDYPDEECPALRGETYFSDDTGKFVCVKCLGSLKWKCMTTEKTSMMRKTIKIRAP